jgi:WD40 repeat protein
LIDLSYRDDTSGRNNIKLRSIRFHIISGAIICAALTAACSREPEKSAPKFTGRLFLLSGDNAAGRDLVELGPSSSSYTVTTVINGVIEAVPNADRTQLLYATKDEILVRDLKSGTAKSLAKGENFCLAWSPDGKRFSYKQKGKEAATKLFVSDLDGKAKLVWDDPFDPTAAGERAARSEGCAQWVSPNRLIFDRLIGAVRKPAKGGETLKPNTTTVAAIDEGVKLVDAPRKWSVEAVCQTGPGVFLRPADQAQPILVTARVDNPKTLDPKPVDCSGCRFVGFAAHSCVPFFVQDNTSTTTNLVSLNPTNWQRQKPATVSVIFSPNARMVIKSSARLMVAGDQPGKLYLIDTESGDFVSFFPGATAPLVNPVPIVWIEN